MSLAEEPERAFLDYCTEGGHVAPLRIFEIDDFTIQFLCLSCHYSWEEQFPVRKFHERKANGQ